MNKTNLQIIEKLKEFLDQSSEDKKEYRERVGDFSRHRKLSFKRVVILIINLLRKSLSIELEHFFETLKAEQSICTKSAFSQARQKLKSNFFVAWNKCLLREFYTAKEDRVKNWRDYLLVGVDGSTSYLFEGGDVSTHFGHHRQKVMGRLLVGYDLLNQLSLYSQIAPIQIGERTIVKPWVSQMAEDFNRPMIIIYDSGFPCYVLMHLHKYYQSDYVMRCALDFNKEVKAFLESSSTQEWVDLFPTDKAIKELRSMGFQISKEDKIEVRLIKIKLKNGETEILISSLLDDQGFTQQDFKFLYGKRWGSETFYDHLKNNLQIEIVSGKTTKAIQQDFYASIFTANIQSLIIQESEQENLKDKIALRKYEYKVNRSVSLGLLKNKIVLIFLCQQPINILQELKSKFIRYLEPIRPNRSFPRTKNNRRRNGKYQTFHNYRRAI